MPLKFYKGDAKSIEQLSRALRPKPKTFSSKRRLISVTNPAAINAKAFFLKRSINISIKRWGHTAVKCVLLGEQLVLWWSTPSERSLRRFYGMYEQLQCGHKAADRRISCCVSRKHIKRIYELSHGRVFIQDLCPVGVFNGRRVPSAK